MPITVQFDTVPTQVSVPTPTVIIDEEILNIVWQTGQYYCVISNNDYGFEIVESQVEVDSGFAGASLENHFGENSEKYFYNKSDNIVVFESEDVYMLVNVEPVKNESYFSINKLEIDEMLLAINS